MSSALQKALQDCQPFKDDCATVVCIGCFKLLAFPSGAKKVVCPNCETVTTGVKIRCTSCQAPLTVRLGSTQVKCGKCQYQFQPMAKLRVYVPKDKRSFELPPQIFVTVRIDSSVPKASRRLLEHVPVIRTQPLRATVQQWENAVGGEFRSIAVFKGATKLLTGKSPMELNLVSGDELEIRRVDEASGSRHDFVSSQFLTPTNCAACNEFIWGIYNQGRKCTKCGVPVHHRCAEGFNGLCEAHLRQMFGIVNFNDEDDEGVEQPVIAVVINDEDKMAFADQVEEVAAPECDKNFMASLNRLSEFTDDQIQQMWLHYDKDGSGTLERDEMKQFMGDIVSASGGKWFSSNAEEAVDRLIHRMDVNGDGLIQWEEFWYFVKAQQDSKFLSQFEGVEITTEKIYELWYHYDQDQSGELEADELLLLLQDLASRTNGKLDPKLGAKMDSLVGPSRKVSWEEFYNVVVPMIKVSVVRSS